MKGKKNWHFADIALNVVKQADLEYFTFLSYILIWLLLLPDLLALFYYKFLCTRNKMLKRKNKKGRFRNIASMNWCTRWTHTDTKRDLSSKQQFQKNKTKKTHSEPRNLMIVPAVCYLPGPVNPPDGCLLFASEWWRKIKTGVFSFCVIERASMRHLAAPSFWYWCLYLARLMNLPKLCNSGSEWDRSSPAM